MQKPPSAPLAGRHVIVRDEPWRVVRTESFAHVTVVTLTGVARANHGDQRTVLVPFDRIELTTGSTRLRARSRQATLAGAARALARAGWWGECWVAPRARIDLHEWQLEPARAVLRGATRVLLADHVGLGKTVQASLIVAELQARDLARRTLVLTPAALRAQWAGEMTERFSLEPVVFDHGSLTTLVSTLPANVNPWRTAPLIVSSIDLVKRPDVRRALDGVPFDVLVVDEAHHLTAQTDREAVVRELAARTPWVVLVTATPHTGDDEAFERLTRLGGADDTPMSIFRRETGGRVVGARRRLSKLVTVTPSDAERDLLDVTWMYAQALRRQRRHQSGRALVASIIARRAASCALAAGRTIARRLQLLGGASTPSAAQPILPWEEHGDDDVVPDGVLSVPGMEDAARERAILERLAALAAAASVESAKVDVVHRVLRGTREQLLVFSEFRDVVEWLAAQLAATTTVGVLHGGLNVRERHEVVRAFNRGQIRTLVSTDAGGEGLNLQERCRLVVNLELPWTPLRLEQRIGRVDRMGQHRRVHALQLVYRGSYESTVIARLERRQSRVDRNALATAPASAHESAATTQRRLEHLSSARPGAPETDRGGALFATRAPRPTSTVTLLFNREWRDSSGGLVASRAVGLHVHVGTPFRLSKLSRQRVRRLAIDDGVQQVLRRAGGDDRATAEAAAFAAFLSKRLDEVARHLAARRRHRPWQGSLFDDRAERRAADAYEDVRTLEAHVARLREVTASLRTVHPAAPTLVAAWLDD